MIRDGVLFRDLAPSYVDRYERLMRSGLYDRLRQQELVLAHEEVERLSDGGVRIRPERVPFISYPYEWCAGQLRDAALATLRIQQIALEYGMSLKDASAFNVQFVRGRAVLIDTASFDFYQEGRPWVAYAQFCRHFLAPLALAAHRDGRLLKLLAAHLDGLPLDLAARLLPWRTRLRPVLALHLHVQAAAGRKASSKTVTGTFRKTSFLGLLESLTSLVSRLQARSEKSAWTGYYGLSQHEAGVLQRKEALVSDILKGAGDGPVWDLGANTGRFGRLATALGRHVVAFDADAAVVEAMWQQARDDRDGRLLPLVMDLANPTPSLGWNHRERKSMLERGPADTVMALALIHHLAIGNNVPLEDVAAFLGRCTGRHLIIEFVPKDDPNVVEMLKNRKDIFAGYTQAAFEAAFGSTFRLVSRQRLEGTGRIIYHYAA